MMLQQTIHISTIFNEQVCQIWYWWVSKHFSSRLDRHKWLMILASGHHVMTWLGLRTKPMRKFRTISTLSGKFEVDNFPSGFKRIPLQEMQGMFIAVVLVSKYQSKGSLLDSFNLITFSFGETTRPHRRGVLNYTPYLLFINFKENWSGNTQRF